MAASDEAPAERALEITRDFTVPRPFLFRLWLEPDHLVRWWGPRGFTMPEHAIDPRPGGAYRFCMRSPTGSLHWLRGAYREIVAPEQLVFTYAWEDATGTPRHETLVTVRLDDRGAVTRLTLRQAAFESAASREAHRLGWASNLDRLADYLAAVD